MLRKIYNKIGQVEAVVCATFIVVIVGLTFISTILRAIKVPLAWSSDVSLLLFGWAAFVGADAAYRHSAMIGVDLLSRKWKPQHKAALNFILNTVILCFCAFLIVNGTQLCIVNYRRTFQALPISYGAANASLPVGCLLMVLTAIEKNITILQTYVLKKKPEGETTK